MDEASEIEETVFPDYIEKLFENVERMRLYYANELSIVTCKKRQRMAQKMEEDDADVV